VSFSMGAFVLLLEAPCHATSTYPPKSTLQEVFLT
jgi:hypothetical protein